MNFRRQAVIGQGGGVHTISELHGSHTVSGKSWKSVHISIQDSYASLGSAEIGALSQGWTSGTNRLGLENSCQRYVNEAQRLCFLSY